VKPVLLAPLVLQEKMVYKAHKEPLGKMESRVQLVLQEKMVKKESRVQRV
jgi:hypothetical protein